MGKKQALGSIPTFENVAKATLTNDLFTEEESLKEENKTIETLLEEPLQENYKEKEDPVEALLNDPKTREEILAKRISNPLENFKAYAEQRKEQLERSTSEARRKEEEPKESKPNEEKRERKSVIASKEKPSTERRLAEGYTRATFEVNKEQLELIKALALYKEMTQKDIIEALIERGLADINETIKKEAVKRYRQPNEEKNKKAKDLFN